MLTPMSPSSVVIIPSTPGTFLLMMTRRVWSGAAASSTAVGKLTELTTWPRSRNLMIWSAAM